MTFVLVSVLYKHVCECIDDPFATPVTDATLVMDRYFMYNCTDLNELFL